MIYYQYRADRARALAGLKGYLTNLQGASPQFVSGVYHRLFQIEKSFWTSKHDLRARPIYHHKRDSIDAHLTIVFAALAVCRWIEERTGWSIRRFVTTARCYRMSAAPPETTPSPPPTPSQTTCTKPSGTSASQTSAH